MAKRTCRACGVSFEYPEPGSLATKRLCDGCMRVNETVRRVLERHQLEITRLKRQVEKLGGTPAKGSDQTAANST